ncbi:hypothetical protein E2320_002293, partial [Naja naja]
QNKLKIQHVEEVLTKPFKREKEGEGEGGGGEAETHTERDTLSALSSLGENERGIPLKTQHLIWAAVCLSCNLGEVQEGNASPVAMLGEGEEESGEEEGRRGSRINRKQEEEEQKEAEAGIAKGAGGGRTWNSVVSNQLQAQLPENL